MLSISNVSKTYGNGVKALNNVNLDIKKGLFGLLGPNGAGKSSLMRTISTLQLPDEGSIMFGDINVIEQPNALRQTLGYLPQDFGVYPRN
jgi:ABC-type multidrug transport system ATPase subunit